MKIKKLLLSIFIIFSLGLITQLKPVNLEASISNQAPDLTTYSQKSISADKITEKVNHYGGFNMFKIDITEIANTKIGKSEFNMILEFDAEENFWENFYYYPDYGLFVNDYYYVLQSGNGEVSLELLENATQLSYESECIEGLNFNQSYVDYFFIQNNKAYLKLKYTVLTNQSNLSAYVPSANASSIKIYIDGDQDTSRPVINGGSGIYLSNYDHPTSVEEILSHIRIVDDVDGDITNKLIIEENHYYHGSTDNRKVLGNHSILISATDNAGNKATFTIIVHVSDITFPVISGTITHQAYNNLQVPIDTLKTFLTASDNYDGDITASITLKSDSYSANYNRVGTHEVVFAVKDSSNNETVHTINIRVVDKINPVISGEETYSAFNNTLTSISIFKALFTASDETDGDITSRIVLKTDGYSSNYNRVGSYLVVFEVSDTAGNKAEKTLTVIVGDKIAPIFSGKFLWENISNLTKLDFDAIKSQITASDETDGDITNRITLKSEDYSVNFRIPGTYSFIYEVTDTAGNRTEQIITIKVIDKEVPIISGTENLVKDAHTPLTVDQIKGQLTASDVQDGNITSKISVKTDNYTGNADTVGTYTIEFEVADNAGNKAYHLVTIVVRDDVPPVFIIDGFIINISVANELTVEQVISILRALGKIDPAMNTYKVLEDTYSGSKGSVGEYRMTFRFSSPNGSTDVQTMNLKVYDPEPVEEIPQPQPQPKPKSKWNQFWSGTLNGIWNGIKAVWNWFVGIFKSIGNFFKDIFSRPDTMIIHKFSDTKRLFL